MFKKFWIVAIALFTICLNSFAQTDTTDVFPDFTRQKPSRNDTIVFEKHLENVENIAKLHLKDTCFDSFVEKGFFYKADNYFDLSVNHQAVNKDSICFTVSFKNTSEHGIYVSLAWFEDTLWNKSARFSTVDDYFGLDCFTYFKMKKISSQEIIEQKLFINHTTFKDIYYDIYIVNDMSQLVLSSSYKENFIRGIYEDRLVVDGILNSNVQEYKGLTKLSILNYPINNFGNKMRFELSNNK